MAVDYNRILDSVEKQFRIVSGGIDKDAIAQSRVSTGLLSLDLILGGGIIPGWYTFYGGEGAAKSTTVMTLIANTLNHEIPIVAYWDYEQAVDPEYMENIIGIIAPGGNCEKLFGVRNPKTGKWSVQPRVRYVPADVGEDFYMATASMLRQLPDKVCQDGQWYYVYPNTKDGKAKAGRDYNKKLFTETGMLYVPAEDGARLQALIILDSYQAMNPESQEEDDPSGGMAMDARMHAAHIKKVRGKLRKKHCAVIGISQLRVNPGQRFGNPEYLSGGNALKHAADGRNKQTARSTPNGSGPTEEEASVLLDGGVDTYKYIHSRNEKNKFATPYCEGWFRIWIDHEGAGRGFCPAYDTYMYLRGTGRITNAMGCDKGNIVKRLNLSWPEAGLETSMNWLDFKALILLKGAELKEHCARLGIKRNPKLRERCFKEMQNGEGFLKFHEVRVGRGAESTDEDSDDDE